MVAMLQGVLKTGFGYAGAIEGIFGPLTEAVLRQYQSDSGLLITGAGPALGRGGDEDVHGLSQSDRAICVNQQRTGTSTGSA
jgi:hypothetical protein